MTTRALAYWIVVLAVASWPLMAQNAPSGPVVLPQAAATHPAPAPSPVVGSPVAPAAVANPDEQDIRDIRGPISIPYPWLWAFYLALGLVAVGLAYALWKWFRRTTIKRKEPFEIALEKLESARRLMDEAHVREYAFEVSEIIRGYIEQRFGERAARRTTEEFLSDLVRQTATPLAEHRALLEDFLNHCDLPKFARWQLSTAEMESMQVSARAFILNTKPGATPVAAARPEPALVK